MKKQSIVDERLLFSPAFAIPEVRDITNKMAELARDTLIEAVELLDQYDDKKAAHVLECEDMLDHYEDQLGTFMVKLSSKELSIGDSQEISQLLLTIGDFERIGDHAANLLDAAKELHDKNIAFSKEAGAELAVMARALRDIISSAIAAFVSGDITLAGRIEPLEQVIDELRAELKLRHIARLRLGLCTIELGFIFSDIISNFERVSDHCSNIAVCAIQIKDSSFETHNYLNELRRTDPEFTAQFRRDLARYPLPENPFTKEIVNGKA